jgi:hypothetical protein
MIIIKIEQSTPTNVEERTRKLICLFIYLFDNNEIC